MASIGDYLDRLVVSATSPDGNIRARVSNYTEVDVAFQRDTFDRYDEQGLSHQLARLGGITWVAYHRARSEAYQKSLGLSEAELADAERPSADPHRRQYEEALSAIEGKGVSAGGAVRIDTRGMTRWNVHIEPDTVRQLGEQRFVTEIHSAITALQADRKMKIILLKSEYFDLGLPRRWRELTAELLAANDARSGRSE